MKREWILLVGVVTATSVIVLASVRWFAPQLLGIPIDLQSVRVSESLPPFYDGIFRRADSEEFLLKDPSIRVRARPFMPRGFTVGPHDLLGFRNRGIPNIADVVVLGDSQTYGVNVLMEYSWPSQLQADLGSHTSVYSMATGGWGAVQYLDMFNKSLIFKPQVLVVAFYSGNDPMESYLLAYGVEKWAPLKVAHDLDESDRPPAAEITEESWQVAFSDGVKTTFTPKHRLQSNDGAFAVVREGWAIMEKVGRKISDMASEHGVALIYTIIPTKELAYKRKVDAEGMDPDPLYSRLVSTEHVNIKRLASVFTELTNVTYVDLVEPLQQAALQSTRIYPLNANGHPVYAGYKTISQAIAPIAKGLVRPVRRSLALVVLEDGTKRYLLLTRRGALLFPKPETAERNGWKLADAKQLRIREFTRLPFLGATDDVDPSKLGPPANTP